MFTLFRQAKAKWTARFASVRLQSRAPWEQKRTIIGMVKSPVEGNSIVLLKLDQQIVFSDFARPICIPDQDDFINASAGTNCITLGWSLDTDELAKVSRVFFCFFLSFYNVYCLSKADHRCWEEGGGEVPLKFI
jgi:hypothetical protein